MVEQIINTTLPVVSEDIAEDSRYMIKENYIIISNKIIHDQLQATKALIHEYTHYYQYCVVENNILKQREPYKKDKATNKEMREYIKEKYNIAVYNCEITAVKKYYGIFKERTNQQDNYRMPTEIKIEVIKETLIHFIYLDADCKPIGEAVDFTPNRSKHYIKKHATYKEIKEYIFETYGVKVHTAYITEIKRKHGVEMINVRSTEESLKRAKHPTPAMTKIIEETLEHFGIISLND